MFKLYAGTQNFRTINRSGLGQVYYGGGELQALDACTPINIALAPLSAVPGIRNLINQGGCCTTAGKAQLQAAINAGVDQAGLSPDVAAAVKTVGGSIVAGCLCKGVSCTGVNPNAPAPKSNTGLYIALAVGLAAILGGVAYTSRKR